MSFKFPLFIAWQYFRKRKGEKMISVISLLSLIGVTIGVAALIVVMAIMNGFHIELTKSIIGLNSDINILPRYQKIEDFAKLKTELESFPFTKKVIPVIVGQALATTNDNSVGAMVKGMDLADIEYKETITKNLHAGSFEDYHGSDKIALGLYLAHELKVDVGDKVKLMSPNTISTIFGSLPRMKEFTVVAIFASGMYEYDSINILMPMEAADRYFSMGSKINFVELYSDDPEKSYEYSKIIRREIGNDYKIRNWKMVYEQSLNAFKLERIAMFAILSLIICVASFNIISSLTMLVKDKAKDIAILKTIGASQNQIMMIFIFNGAFIGIIGTILGVVIGVSFTMNIEHIKIALESMTGITIFDAAVYFLENLPAKLLPSNVFAVAGLSLGLSLLATIYPARKAAKMNPVDIIRYE
jgi:lipoprotein-releasing system permease protein